MSEAYEWLKRAKSSLVHGKNVNKKDLINYGGDICFEELCFDLQQCAEKSLKALLIHNNIAFPKIHDISDLITLLENNQINLPEHLKDSTFLTRYAVKTRYPDDFAEVNEEEYNKALEMAENVFSWSEIQLKK